MLPRTARRKPPDLSIPLIHLKRFPATRRDHAIRTPSDKPAPPPKLKPVPKPREWLVDKALRNIEAYADNLRELFRKLKGRLH
ncbi:hypothetical protein I3J27_23770 [Bradyrhizobium xenonodulans]|uniref:Transposase n=1 Tax=Bradyrhizobium xenonodulans TaxID=2736875 RepID=A0ABY7MCI7_9BRAD|nr:hypothetical protein [Bradyrhizobium xenonodulans]WBL76041.1 hypothetical protein I3J27_23770 [Bradyrhizobium xenonodulans]